jgi:hypothetical protein
MAIKLEYVKVSNYKKYTGCPYNDALQCTVKNCNCCGWNPKVAKLRLNKFLRKGE